MLGVHTTYGPISLHLHKTMEVFLLPLVVSVHTFSVASKIIDRCDSMSYRMSERDYVSLATYMSVKSLLQFGIHLGALVSSLPTGLINPKRG